MEAVVIGSINLDLFLDVPDIVKPGETIVSTQIRKFPGGKGLNQAVALARSGLKTTLLGAIGAEDRESLLLLARESGVNCERIVSKGSNSGSAIIQVAASGENSIIISGGANQQLSSEDFHDWVNSIPSGAFLVIQNEISCIEELFDELTRRRDIKVVLNIAPYSSNLNKLPLGICFALVANERELMALTKSESIETGMTRLEELLPAVALVVTLGAEGAIFSFGGARDSVPGIQVEVKDTTGAGDTFIGFFVRGLTEGKGIKAAVELGVKAASISVTRFGAAPSIPFEHEVK